MHIKISLQKPKKNRILVLPRLNETFLNLNYKIVQQNKNIHAFPITQCSSKLDASLYTDDIIDAGKESVDIHL